jgi:WD40 repeat protein
MTTEGVSAFLNFTHCYGARSGVRDNVVHTGENSIAYPVGRHMCVYNAETKDMSFLLQADNVETMTAIATSPHTRKYLGVCEQLTDGGAQVTIFSTASEKKVKTLSHPDCKQFTALCFSSDSKFLVTIGGAPEYTMIYWNWLHAKVVASCKIGYEVKRVSFSPLDNVQIATCGPSLLKLWRLQDTVSCVCHF